MSVGKSTSPNPIVPLEGNIKVVEYFKYLGVFSSADSTNVKVTELAKQQGHSESWRRFGKTYILT